MRKPNKILSILLCLLLISEQPGLAQGLPSFPQPQPLLRYLSVNSANPNNYFNFLMDNVSLTPSKFPTPKVKIFNSHETSVVGNRHNGLNGHNGLNDEAKKLVNYFFLGLTLPSDAFWVNLQPSQADRITSKKLAKTDLGRTLLEQDLKLKKDMARLLHPKDPVGKQYWERLYQRIADRENLNVKRCPLSADNRLNKFKIQTSNRVWITPDQAVVMETEDGALVAKATLKVMLENEYLSSTVSSQRAGAAGNETIPPARNDNAIQILSEQLMKEIVLPVITEKVNTDPGYAPLRQVYYSLVLAEWYKRKTAQMIADEKQQMITDKRMDTSTKTIADTSAKTEGLRGGEVSSNNPYSSYINSGTTAGLESSNPWSKDALFQEYLKSYAQGEYKIKDTIFGLKRMYFSGGILFSLKTDPNTGASPLKIKPAPKIDESLPREILEGLQLQNMALVELNNSVAGDGDILSAIEINVVETKEQTNPAINSFPPSTDNIKILGEKEFGGWSVSNSLRQAESIIKEIREIATSINEKFFKASFLHINKHRVYISLNIFLSYDKQWDIFKKDLKTKTEPKDVEPLQKNIAKIEELRQRFYLLSKWDFVNRFPGATGIVVWKGAKSLDEAEDLLRDLNQGEFSYIPLNAVKNNKTKIILEFYVPVEAIRLVSWLIHPREDYFTKHLPIITTDGKAQLKRQIDLHNEGALLEFMQLLEGFKRQRPEDVFDPIIYDDCDSKQSDYLIWLLEFLQQQNYIQPVDEQGFTIGGVNKSEIISNLKHITGIPIAEIEKTARPRKYSHSGFLGNEEQLVGILTIDNEFVLGKNFTHQQLAEPLFYVMNLFSLDTDNFDREKNFSYNGMQYNARYVKHQGYQGSIFADNLLIDRDFIIKNESNNQEISFSGILPYYIWRYGFYEGNTSYRLEPQDIINTFFSPDADKINQPLPQSLPVGASVQLGSPPLNEANQSASSLVNGLVKPEVNSQIPHFLNPRIDKGGIDLNSIDFTLKNEQFVSSLNPADFKILLAAKALKQGLNPLSLLRIHEVLGYFKDKITKPEAIQNQKLLKQVLSELRLNHFLDFKTIGYLRFLERGGIFTGKPTSKIY